MFQSETFFPVSVDLRTASHVPTGSTEFSRTCRHGFTSGTATSERNFFEGLQDPQTVKPLSHSSSLGLNLVFAARTPVLDLETTSADDQKSLLLRLK